MILENLCIGRQESVDLTPLQGLITFGSMANHAILDMERRLTKALELMESEIEGHPSLARLSNAASLSQYYFLRVFKTTIGETPLRYFRRQKALRADAYLANNPEIDLTTLAFKFGYSSQSALTRDFKTLLGFLPGTCRAEFQKTRSNFRQKHSNS